MFKIIHSFKWNHTLLFKLIYHGFRHDFIVKGGGEVLFYFIFSLQQPTCIDIFYTHITFNTPWYFLVCMYITPIYLDDWGGWILCHFLICFMKTFVYEFLRPLKHPNRWTIWQYLHTSMLESSETRISPNKNLKIWFPPHVTHLHLDCEDESVNAVQAYNWCLLWQSVKKTNAHAVGKLWYSEC